jgi:hypothetical protein
MSAGRHSASAAPRSRASFATSSPATGSRPVITSRAPSSANASAMPRPMLAVEAVTMTTLPASPVCS